ncbi:PREDICTED: uncharacterized protein LOC104809981 isoform X2 [Tarenaya hassleriana]|uniref:uncharacterized protein LOC104802074 isoform X2 n=1 Tax=Tarenaya hassleriana TaxID=28532 RepID=UPI00053C2DED|nr:PREDICTED: uncharacterized protein LOC104802074 isoform X2 [Tarenaya hassleriana]XP_010534433.1 PREDICTED: uncharacterized protein LOC104809981 isoform X2 [Tarenaya hassleriana]
MDSLTLKPTFTSFYPSPLFLTSINRFEASTVSFCCKPHSNPICPQPDYGTNRILRINPYLILRSIFRRIKGLASSQSQRWVSRSQAYRDDTAAFSEQFAGDWEKHGGFGTALLSVTASAKVKISPFVATLAANPTFVSGLVAWFVAQSIKVFLNFFVERKWDFRILFASGGMPSSHSALCMALTTSVALCHGVADSLFPVCLGFSLIVMYDAIGVRRHAGMQAECWSKNKLMSIKYQ